MLSYPGHLKIFIKESHVANTTPNKVTREYFPTRILTGKEAKACYENIVEGSGQSAKKRPKRSVKSLKCESVKRSAVFVAAQGNDVKTLENYLETNGDVNIQDSYAWTPLMCASCAGSTEAVQTLIQYGAKLNICDKSGNTAYSLAKQNHHHAITHLLTQFNNTVSVMSDNKSMQGNEPYTCPAGCGTFNMNQQEHESSTLHLFNTKRVKNHTYYGIPESNRGFQMLLSTGWNRDKGLGPQGRGKKYPIKTKMKNNRRGIGAPEAEEKSIKPGFTKPKTKHNIKSVMHKERLRERFLRSQLS